MPFSISDEPEMVLIAAENDLQITPQASRPANASQNGLYSSSSDMVSQPGSSWLDEFERQEQNDDTPCVIDHLMVHKSNDDIAMNYEDKPESRAESRRYPNAVREEASEHLRKDSSTRKRVASIHETEKAYRKPKAFGVDQLHQSQPDGPVFSFTKPTESFASKTTRHALSCDPSVNTSFNSVSTDINESFVTNATSPSFNLQTGNRVLNINTPSGSPADSIEPSDKFQKYLRIFKQASPFGKCLCRPSF